MADSPPSRPAKSDPTVPPPHSPTPLSNTNTKPLPVRPPYDPTLSHILAAYPIPDDLNLDQMRGLNLVPENEPNPFNYTAETVLAAHAHYTHREFAIAGVDDNGILLSVFTPSTIVPRTAPPAPLAHKHSTMDTNDVHPNHTATKIGKLQLLPALYHIHGGAQVSGSRFAGLAETMCFLPSSQPCIIITVEYRLAPEYLAPSGAEDCYTGLAWLFAHTTTLGIDAGRVVVYGVSGGGALAASITLMARDRGLAHAVKGVMLHAPMLDDRCTYPSDIQFHTNSPWSGVSNIAAWDLALGPGVRSSPQVSTYQAPAREVDYPGLPPMYVDVAECEVFRDAAVAWAGKVWKAGGNCELHIWPGVWHIFDMMDENTPVVKMAKEAKKSWLGKMMGCEEVR